MHYKFIVAVSKHNAKDSKEARNWVEKYLIDEGFIQQGEWCCGPADWFTIGGRWSGELCKTTKEFFEKLKSLDDSKSPQELWEELGNDSTNPTERDTYVNYMGYEDDAMVIDDRLLEYIEECKKAEDSLEHYHNSIEWGDVEPGIGDWLVVVDYHN